MPDSIVIRKASKTDLATIEAWLRAEYENHGEGFFCNWRAISEAFERRDLIVLAANGDVVGFIADAKSGPEILEVRRDARRKRYGARLAEYAINAAFDRGNSIVAIECAPETSVPFWKRMGFTLIGRRFAHKILRREFQLGIGRRKSFKIVFFPESVRWQKDTKPLGMYEGAGVADGDSLQLPERAICLASNGQSSSDNVVRIETNGKLLFEGKVKYAEPFGVYRDASHVFYIDKILRCEEGR